MVIFFGRAQTRRVTGKVVVFGATTNVGKHLSLLLTLCPQVKELCCFDPLNDVTLRMTETRVRGIVKDLSHIDTGVVLRAVDDPQQWEPAMRNAQLVLICTGSIPNPSRLQRDLALAECAPEYLVAMELVARAAPHAIVGIASGPVNSLVPLAREMLLRHSAFDPRKLFGITSRDVMRTRVLFAKELHMNPYDVNVHVVGGKGDATVCPLITQTGFQLSHQRMVQLCEEVQRTENFTAADHNSTGCRVDSQNVQGQEKFTCPTLSTANAAYEWVTSIMKAQRGDRGITECSFVESSIKRETPFFSSRVELGEEGAAQLLPLGALTPYEEELVAAAVPLILEDVEAGLRLSKTGVDAVS
ncbi:malate dehydrogenase-related [Trypanosoma brucei equiperdum]|uniref:malate dehydrogenase n=1 Tax=Trypanosoma brucei equiperdum TaxID=630700 RepID=A0A3L6KXS5_9TRYP|nr:malate dehydrogenase-related [Trypanosoma brucei equiperdum]